MTPPVVRQQNLSDSTWWFVCARYPSAHMARAAWERLDRKLAVGDLGMYRHGPSYDPGTQVTAVSMTKGQVERAARLLKDGEDQQLSPSLSASMIVRRARVVVEMARQDPDHSRRLKIRRPGEGSPMRPDGTMIEPEPGRG